MVAGEFGRFKNVLGYGEFIELQVDGKRAKKF